MRVCMPTYIRTITLKHTEIMCRIVQHSDAGKLNLAKLYLVFTN